MCAGSDFNGVFTSCMCAQCSLYTVHGAHVNLKHCNFNKCHPGAVVSCPGSVGFFYSCSFQACLTAIIIEDDAAVFTDACIMHGGTVALCANAGGSLHCEYTIMHGGPRHGAGLFGVLVHNASVCLRRCGIQAFCTALMVRGGCARAEVLDSYAYTCRRSVAVVQHAQATVWTFEMT